MSGLWDSLMQMASPNPPPAPPPQQDLQQMATLGKRQPTIPMQSVPFYPSEAHIKYKWAPEQTLQPEVVDSIAKARRMAETSGVLTSELGEHLLPIAMVEGWGGSMGINGGTKDYYASRRMLNSLDKMGLMEGKDFDTYSSNGDKYVEIKRSSPAMAAVLLSEKAKLKMAGGTVEGAVKAYNGYGKAQEEMYGDTVPADVDVYWNKIQTAKRLLAHPLNQQLKDRFERAYHE